MSFNVKPDSQRIQALVSIPNRDFGKFQQIDMLLGSPSIGFQSLIGILVSFNIQQANGRAMITDVSIPNRDFGKFQRGETRYFISLPVSIPNRDFGKFQR